MSPIPSNTYVGGAVVAAMLAIAGAWLPWVRKLPVRSDNGVAVYTSEYVPGLDPGFDGLDPFVLLIVAGLLAAVLFGIDREWRPDGLFIVGGGILSWGASTQLLDYRSVDRYVLEPGLYLVLAGGLLFLIIGTGGLLFRLRSTADREHNSPRNREEGSE